jgi:hypothetical protein
LRHRPMRSKDHGGADAGSRTRTLAGAPGFEAGASSHSATSAWVCFALQVSLLFSGKDGGPLLPVPAVASRNTLAIGPSGCRLAAQMLGLNCARVIGEARTHDLLGHNQALRPTELRSPYTECRWADSNGHGHFCPPRSERGASSSFTTAALAGTE